MRRISYVMGAIVAVLLPIQLPASAAPSDDLAAIRNDISTLRHDYEAKIKDLESRLRRAEAEAKAAKASAAAAQAAANSSAAAQKNIAVAQTAPVAPPPSQPATPRAPTSPNAFNPAIGVVLNGFFAASSRDTEAQAIRGFVLGEEAGLVPRGFSLGESEVNFAANIDPYLRGALVLAFTNSGEAEVEEAYLATTDLGGGFTVKGGRFLSAIGYLNEHHAHQWTFPDSSLPYRAFLGGQLGDDGVQMKWLAPIGFFLELGAEWFRGDSFPAGNGANEGKGTATAFVHAGDDIDESSSWLAGVSYLHSRADGRDTGGDTFSGTDDIGIASLVYKWAPGGNPTQRNLALSGEFFVGREDGSFNGVPINLTHTGWYAQAVYQFMPHWSAGLRYAEVTPDDVPVALMGSALDDFGRAPRATTALLEYDTTEFGRFRLQYSHDQSDLRPNDEILFQYTVVYGAHGAHRY